MNTDLIIDLHSGLERLGPGGIRETRLALDLSGLRAAEQTLAIADIGCGTGASTLVLAEELDARITAVDLFPAFLETLDQMSAARGLNQHITTLPCSMDALPFEPGSLDALWAEGAIYNLGFERGLSVFRQFLKPGGIIAVSEITWLTQARPDELNDYWVAEYPEITGAAENINTLSAQGFVLRGYFPLPENCWLDNYYEPLEARFEGFLATHSNSAEAESLVAAQSREIDLYRRYRDHVSYGFYIAEKR